ncbi:MAG: hypothetical protein K8T91_16655 [Planctomycetes bacterium]|nr:hypothetical protein [Planctomycetota bacterium]
MSSTSRLPHVPRLSIANLLFFTAVTAAVLSSPIELETSTPVPSMGEAVSSIFFRVMYGAGITGLFLIFWHTARRSLWPLEPGEWLVVAWGGSILLGLFQMTIQSPLNLAHILEHPQIYRVIWVTVILLTASFEGAVAIGARRYPWWSVLIGICAMWRLLWGIGFITMPMHDTLPWAYSFFRYLTRYYFAQYWVGLALLAMALIGDRKCALSRHWLHWLGVALLGITHVVVLAMWLLM